MSAKTKRRLLQLLGFIIGLIFGWYRPMQVQSILPLLGIGVGIGYFILSRSLDNERKLADIPWFIPLQMVMYFIIGGALTSSITIALEYL